MQMKALRSANFAKLSSSSSTRDVYWVTSISAGTPAGYCFSQMRSMVFPLPVYLPLLGWAVSVLGSIERAMASGKPFALGGSMTDLKVGLQNALRSDPPQPLLRVR